MGATYTNAGIGYIVDLIDHTTSATGWYVGWGTGSATDTATATALTSEATEARVTATTEDQPSSDTNRWIATLTAGSAKTVYEAGLFNTATTGILIIMGTHAAIAVATGDQVQYTITLQQT